MKTVKVKLDWLKLKETSSQPVISSIPYRPIIVFKEKALRDLPNEPVFSVEIFNEKIDKKTSIASLTIRSPKAPLELMKLGAEFELYEASKKVAVGKIIEEIN